MEDGECFGVAGNGEDFGIGGVAANDLCIVVTVDLTGEDCVGVDVLYGSDNVGEGEVSAECLPGAVGGGFEEGDVEGDGVVYVVVVDVAGGDAVGMLVMAVEVADTTHGQHVPPHDNANRRCDGQRQKGLL